MSIKRTELKISVDEFLDDLFKTSLSDSDEFDFEVIELIKTHLGQRKIHSKAGNNLAEALIKLAKSRSQEVKQ